MRDVLQVGGAGGAGARLGYCTNVHAGSDLSATLANLERHAADVRRRLVASGRLAADARLGVGLWLSAEAASGAKKRGGEVRERLAALGLEAFTVNAFPFSDFHERVVKHRVYRPNWSDPRRLAYTLDVIDVLHGVLSPGEEGSISTLPIGWGRDDETPVDEAAAVGHLREAARRLARLEAETGRLIHVDLEPEPGCVFDTSAGAVEWWERRLLAGADAGLERAIRRHVRVCHDVCHAAVMFEPQEEALAAYERAGIGVGKVQVSSALAAGLGGADSRMMLDELARFCEPRYLHQTVRRGYSSERPPTKHEDLGEAIDARLSAGVQAQEEWRVHFHVPVYLERIGRLGTTRDEIVPAVRRALVLGVRHFEVETYAWGVLPAELRRAELAEGIAKELAWVIDAMDEAGGAASEPTRGAAKGRP